MLTPYVGVKVVGQRIIRCKVRECGQEFFSGPSTLASVGRKGKLIIPGTRGTGGMHRAPRTNQRVPAGFECLLESKRKLKDRWRSLKGAR